MSTVNHLENAGRRLANRTPTFQFVRLEAIENGALLTGRETDGVMQRGPRKGRPRFVGEYVKVFVSDADEARERTRFEAETGLCADCGGDGKRWAGWSQSDGHRWAECKRCDGQGKAPR